MKLLIKKQTNPEWIGCEAVPYRLKRLYSGGKGNKDVMFGEDFIILSKPAIEATCVFWVFMWNFDGEIINSN